ncbi:MAG: ATP-grasp domain-containing protein [Planctomycetota bacterium]
MVNVAFLLPFAFETSLRFLEAALGLPGVRVGVVGADPIERLGPALARRLAGHWRVADPLDPRAIVAGVVGLQKQMGPIARLVGVLEEAQVPLAVARAELGLPGLDPDSALNFRDKARMKDVLTKAGVPCARHRLVSSMTEARAFASEVGYPLVVKPPSGAGARGTFRLDRAEQLEDLLPHYPPRPERPLLVEEFVTGEEHSFDSVVLGGELVWSSVSRYFPSPLEVLRNDWIQWAVLLPREVDGPEYQPIRAAAARALPALGLRDGLSHMEWFRRRDGSVAISEVGARPPGAQFTSLMSWAHDADLYRAWARLAIGDRFDPPERRFAAGAVYLRGQGRGKRVVAVRGLERAQRETGELVVECRLPRRGQRRSSSYEGEGYVIVRHPETGMVVRALERILETVRVELG